jgi:hypothetical protein
MELADEMTEEDMAHAAARETRRLELVRGMSERAEAQKVYDKANNARKKVAAEEEKRAKESQRRLDDAREKVTSAHNWLAHCSECETFLLAEYVDRDLVSARDKARSAMVIARKAWESLDGIAAQQREMIRARSVKTIQAAKVDSNQEPVFDKGTGKRLFGPTANPNYWSPKSGQMKHAVKLLEELEIDAAEGEAKLAAVNKVYNAAEAALSAAIAEASRG